MKNLDVNYTGIGYVYWAAILSKNISTFLAPTCKEIASSYLQSVRSGIEVVFSLFGLFFAVLTLYYFGTALVHLGDPASAPLGVFIYGLGSLAGFFYLLFCVDEPVTTIPLRQHQLIRANLSYNELG